MILLDTHVWLRWLIKEGEPLPEKLIDLIESTDEIGVSAMSCWEVAYLYKRNRIELPISLFEWMPAALHGSGVQSLPLQETAHVI